MDYWKECISEALDEVGITATPDQVATIAEWVEGAHENYGMATGDHVASANAHAAHRQQIADVQKALDDEKRKIPCPACHGRGSGVECGPVGGWRAECSRCEGYGRVSP